MSIVNIKLQKYVRDDLGKPFVSSIVTVPSLDYVFLRGHWQRIDLML